MTWEDRFSLNVLWVDWMISHSVACCFVQMMAPFAAQKLLVSMRPSSVHYGSYSLCYWCSVQSFFPCQWGQDSSPLLSDSVYLASCWGLWFLELSFVQGGKYGSNCIFLYAAICFDQYHFVKDALFFFQYVFTKNQVSIGAWTYFGVLYPTDQSVCFCVIGMLPSFFR